MLSIPNVHGEQMIVSVDVCVTIRESAVMVMSLSIKAKEKQFLKKAIFFDQF